MASQRSNFIRQNVRCSIRWLEITAPDGSKLYESHKFGRILHAHRPHIAHWRAHTLPHSLTYRHTSHPIYLDFQPKTPFAINHQLRNLNLLTPISVVYFDLRRVMLGIMLNWWHRFCAATAHSDISVCSGLECGYTVNPCQYPFIHPFNSIWFDFRSESSCRLKLPLPIRWMFHVSHSLRYRNLLDVILLQCCYFIGIDWFDILQIAIDLPEALESLNSTQDGGPRKNQAQIFLPSNALWKLALVPFEPLPTFVNIWNSHDRVFGENEPILK